MKGKFYGIGVGPGDPELITLKGIRILKSADVIAIPESRNEKGSLAYGIAYEHLKKGVEVLNVTFPMIRDEREKQEKRKENAMRIKEEIDRGKVVAFLTLGDPMLYSTYIYLYEYLKESDIEIETVPGISAFSAIVSAINLPLAKKNESLCILSLEKDTDIEGFLRMFDNLVIMKASVDNVRLANVIKNYNEELSVVIASKIGMAEENISYDIEDLYNDVPYLTTVIMKKRRMSRNTESV